VPDKAHVVLELKKGASPVSIARKRTISQRAKTTPVLKCSMIRRQKQSLMPRRLSRWRSIYVDASGHGTIRSAPIANSSDGLGGELSEAEPKWYGFGHAGLPAADVGFAIASPVLLMQEGTRKVKLTLHRLQRRSVEPGLHRALSGFRGLPHG